MIKITVKYIETSSWSIREGDEHFTCDHEFAEAEPPCCKFPTGEYGRWDCGCYGQYSIYCPDCEPDEFEVEALFERLVGEPEYV